MDEDWRDSESGRPCGTSAFCLVRPGPPRSESRRCSGTQRCWHTCRTWGKHRCCSPPSVILMCPNSARTVCSTRSEQFVRPRHQSHGHTRSAVSSDLSGFPTVHRKQQLSDANASHENRPEFCCGRDDDQRVFSVRRGVTSWSSSQQVGRQEAAVCHSLLMICLFSVFVSVWLNLLTAAHHRPTPQIYLIGLF